jgi:hypothetical protein
MELTGSQQLWWLCVCSGKMLMMADTMIKIEIKISLWTGPQAPSRLNASESLTGIQSGRRTCERTTRNFENCSPTFYINDLEMV